jgi:2-methylfumaryl-CoA hydratase
MKTNPGRFFEDYQLGETIAHAVPRTVSGGERALYHALYPVRSALYSSDEFARACGLAAATILPPSTWSSARPSRTSR